MAKVVGLHTQSLAPPEGVECLGLLGKVIRAARLRDSFPSSAKLRDLLRALALGLEREHYDDYLFDARTGLPNLASVTRVATDLELMHAGTFTGDSNAQAYARELQRLHPIPVDEIEAAIRRFDPRAGRAEVRVRVTKLDGSGRFTRITVDFTSTKASWVRPVLRLDDDGVRVALTEPVETMIYRHAAFDAEMLFLRLSALEGVTVERVERGLVGPVFFALARGDEFETLAEPAGDALADGWRQVLSARPPTRSVALGAFQTDIAAVDVQTEKSNDPLAPLLGERLDAQSAGIHAGEREAVLFKVYRDCKFVTSPELRAIPESLMRAGNTRNLVYEIR